MNEQRQQILHMLAEGKITAQEADRLLLALQDSSPAGAGAGERPSGSKAAPRYLRVVVDEGEEGGTRVNIRVPLQLIRAGVKLATLLPESARSPVDQALSEAGVPFDLSRIKASEVEELVEFLADLSVDIDDKDESVKVRIFAE
ncbi:MAG: hypothetical protein QG608_811 [Actinomycetota bacterium]|nr:hypothetical protein [Actinomycetota bacterium]